MQVYSEIVKIRLCIIIRSKIDYDILSTHLSQRNDRNIMCIKMLPDRNYAARSLRLHISIYFYR